MKRLITLVAVLLGTMGATAGVASAAQPANCNGGTVLSANYVERDGVNVAAIQLCHRGDSYYGMYINYGTVARGHYANAELTRYYNGEQARWTCDSPGGNGHVQAGQTWCVTPSINSPSSNVHFAADGYLYQAQNGQYVTVGHGNTWICNRYNCR